MFEILYIHKTSQLKDVDFKLCCTLHAVMFQGHTLTTWVYDNIKQNKLKIAIINLSLMWRSIKKWAYLATFFQSGQN